MNLYWLSLSVGTVAAVAGLAGCASAPPASQAARVDGDFQKVLTGTVAPQLLGLAIWGPQGVALNGVGIAPRDLARFPKYTGGLLVQDTNGDRRLDPAEDKVVGGIIGAAPAGAMGQSATSPVGADGAPVLSGTAAPGVLTVQFKAGSMPGLYRPTFELMGGNAHQFTIQAMER